VDWVPKDQKDNNQHTGQVVELPSGQERRRFELPQRPWVKITKWDGQRLEAIVSSPAGPANESLWSTCLFDLSHDPVGDGVEDPLGHGDVDGAKERFWQYGPDWVAYIRVLPPPGPPTKVQLWKDWLLAKIGMGRAPASGLKVTARFVDRASGATRYELPSPLQLSCFVE
jgi:hypothetical protein